MKNLHSSSLNIKTHLHLNLPISHFNLFSELFMSGVFIKTNLIGESVYDFLLYELELDNDFINNRIGTIFINGMPVDDLFSSKLVNESHIALSSAMPGLVGAILRRGSPYAVMREDITFKCTQKDYTTYGFILLKLFNLLINDIGKKILQKGIFLEPSIATDYLSKKGLLASSSSIILNELKTTPNKVLSTIKNVSNNELVAISTTFLC